MKKAIGIDIGGTKIAAGIISESGELLNRAEVKSDPSDRENMFKQVVTAVEQGLDGTPFSEIEGIGVGVPGKVDRVNGIAVFRTICRGSSFRLGPVYRSNLAPSQSRLITMSIWRHLPNGKRHRENGMRLLST